MTKLSDFPKLHCPFIRKTFEVNKDDHKKYGRALQLRKPNVYLVINEVNPGYEWVFDDPDTFCCEKLDGCLYFRTPILTDKGSIPIGQIVNQKMDVEVLSYNFDRQITEFKKITHYHKEKRVKEFLVVYVKSKYRGRQPAQITVTPNHRFFTPSGYVRADELKPHDTVLHMTKSIDYVRKQIILGTLLGDSSIYWGSDKINCGFQCGHSIKQSEYFDLKIKLLGNLVKEGKGFKGGFPGSMPNRRLNSVINGHISSIIKENCLVDYKKTVTPAWVNFLGPIALTFWYLDDGSICTEGSKTQREAVSIATNTFSTDEINLLQNKLYESGVESNIQNSSTSKGNILRLTSDGSDIFFNLIAPYVIKELQYKLPKRFRTGKSYWDHYISEPDNDLIETEVLGILPLSKHPHKKVGTEYQYDLTIEDNPNYFANRILVHNSNVKILTDHGRLVAVQNRKNIIDPLQVVKGQSHLLEGIFQAIGKGYVAKDGEQAGELIGPKLQGNPYELITHLWYPFEKAIKHLRYNSFDEHDRTFENWSMWFKDYLFSRFTTKRGNSNIMAEGIVIYNLKRKEEGKIYRAKLRRDMFSWHFFDKIEIYNYKP